MDPVLEIDSAGIKAAWAQELASVDRSLCEYELNEALAESIRSGDPEEFATALREWKETADSIADMKANGIDVYARNEVEEGDFGEVERPMALAERIAEYQRLDESDEEKERLRSALIEEARERAVAGTKFERAVTWMNWSQQRVAEANKIFREDVERVINKLEKEVGGL